MSPHVLSCGNELAIRLQDCLQVCIARSRGVHSFDRVRLGS